MSTDNTAAVLEALATAHRMVTDADDYEIGGDRYGCNDEEGGAWVYSLTALHRALVSVYGHLADTILERWQRDGGSIVECAKATPVAILDTPAEPVGPKATLVPVTSVRPGDVLAGVVVLSVRTSASGKTVYMTVRRNLNGSDPHAAPYEFKQSAATRIAVFNRTA